MKLDQPLLLWLLPLALLPLLLARGAALPHAWLAYLPRDRAAHVLQAALRAAAVLAVVALVVGLAGPYRPEAQTSRIGRGAETVLLLDRSLSMDQGFAGARAAPPKGNGPEVLDYYARLRSEESRRSKGKVARDLLAEFAAKRPQDRFAMLVFSKIGRAHV